MNKTRSGRKLNARRLTFLPFLLPSLFGVGIFVMLPFLDVFRRSFTQAVSTDFVGIENYKTVFLNDAFRLAVKNTARFTVV